MLMEYRRQIRRTLGSPSLDYITVSGTQVLRTPGEKDIYKFSDARWDSNDTVSYH